MSGKMAQQAKRLAAKVDNLNFIPGTYGLFSNLHTLNKCTFKRDRIINALKSCWSTRRVRHTGSWQDLGAGYTPHLTCLALCVAWFLCYLYHSKILCSKTHSVGTTEFPRV